MATYTNSFHLEKPAWNELVDVSVINSNSDIIDAQMHANQVSATQAVGNMAATYDATVTYELNDFVTYNNKLYKCIDAVETPEAFDAEKWEETTAAENFGSGGGNANDMELTKAEYDALTPAEKMNGTNYFIKDWNLQTHIQPVIYSLEEREVGVWTDGKPLYCKVFAFETPLEISAAGHATSDEWIITECAQIDGTIVEGRFIDSYNQLVNPIIIAFSSQVQKYIFKADTSINGRMLVAMILYYTKTADTPGSGTWTPSGVLAEHYDDTERIVGSWFGGTLYQKTVYCGYLESAGVYKLVNININIDKVISCSGFEYRQSEESWDIHPLPYASGGSEPGNVALYVEKLHGQERIVIYSQKDHSQYQAYVTLKYTKATT